MLIHSASFSRAGSVVERCFRSSVHGFGEHFMPLARKFLAILLAELVTVTSVAAVAWEPRPAEYSRGSHEIYSGQELASLLSQLNQLSGTAPASAVPGRAKGNREQLARVFKPNFPAPALPPLVQSGPPAPTIDANVSKNSTTTNSNIVSPSFSTTASNELLLALIAANAGGPNMAVSSVTGGGLTWVRVVRTNAQTGDAEIWRAFAANPLSSVTVTANLSQPVLASMQVLSFIGADSGGAYGSGAIGAVASANSISGAPSASLVSVEANSLVFGVGFDWDSATSRTVPSGQTITHQYTPATPGVSFWMQRIDAPTPAIGTTVTLNDLAPTTDRYNLSIVEILPQGGTRFVPAISSLSPNSSTPGTSVVITGSHFGGTQGTGGVTFNGVPAAISNWNSTSITAIVPSLATSGNVIVTASDGSVGAGVPFAIQRGNTGIAVDASTYGDATLATTQISSQAFSTNYPNELLLAFISADAQTPNQTVTGVSGGGLTWVPVIRTNAQTGDAEIWRAFATTAIPSLVVTANLSQGAAASIQVVSFTGVNISGTNGSGAIGAVASANSLSGPPSASLVSQGAGSLVVGVGCDWDSDAPRTPGQGQSVMHQLLPPSVGSTFWMQQVDVPTAAIGTTVTVNDIVPAADRYNLSIVEVLPLGGPRIVPIIDTLSPASATPGTSITIAGSHFGNSQGKGGVTFNGAAAAITNWTDTSITAKVPALANTGNVIVTAADGGASSGTAFTVLSNGSAISIDVNVATDSPDLKAQIASPSFSTSVSNELLLAFIATDSISAGVHVNGVTGGNLTWALVKRTNTQNGDAEIWRAVAATPLANAAVTANLSQAIGASIQVLGFTGVDTSGTFGSGAIGAVASANALSGAPSASLVTTRANSLVVGVGFDWDGGVARTVPADQSLLHQFALGTVGTAWVQQLDSPSASAGATVTINDLAPTTDKFNLSIAEILPAPATTGPTITSLSPTTGSVNTPVTITGSNLGSPQGTSTVTFAGVSAVPTSWSNTTIVVPVPQGVPLGAVSVVVTVPGAGSSPPATFTVVAPLAVTESVTPAPNGAGWNNTNATISYQCTGGAPPVQCPPSQTVTTEGGNQVFTATATDANGSQASVTTTLRIDKTAPALSITSPANGSVVSSPTLVVSGTLTDVLSGVASASCNSIAASIQNGAFSCSLTLAPGPNTISVLAIDVAGNTSTQSISVTLGPAITDFTPKTGPIGTAVSIQGTGLTVPPNASTVTFAGPAGPVAARINFASATQLAVVVPDNAITGPITVTTSAGTATTASPFTVGPTQDFQITVSPGTGTLQQGSRTSFVVAISSQQATFTQLATLSVTGLPQGVAAGFTASQITAGASSTLSIDLSATSLAVGSYPFTVHAVAAIAGQPQERTAGATLNVIAAGQTTLAGQVVSTANQPIVGATVSIDGISVLTDGAGRFLLTGVQAGTGRSLSIDGHSASAPNATFPLIFEPVNVIAGRANVVSTPFHLPPIDTSQEVTINPTVDTVAGNAAVTNLQMTIPVGAHLRMLDGTLVTRTSITPLAPDRTPAPLPSDVGTNIVYTSQPGGAITDIPIPVVYPNLAGLDPGTRVELYAFDHAHVNWFVYGFGRVSADGRTIAPEINPATGKPYGLPDFSWHFPNTGPNGNPGSCDGSPSCYGSNPVDYSTGMKIENVPLISWGGARGGVDFSVIFTTDKATNCDTCPFGRGWTHNWDFRLSGSLAPGGAGRLIAPGQVTGRLFSSSGTDSSGSQRFISTVGSTYLGGSIVRSPSTTQFVDRHGTTWSFDGSGRLTSKVDTNGNATSLTYSNGNLTKITDAVGRSLNFVYDSSNRVTSITDPIGRTWHFTYEGTPGVAGLPGLTTISDPAGHVLRYTYVTGGRIAAVTDPRGNTAKQITYDQTGRVASETFADGGTETYSYQLSGTIVTNTVITDRLGKTRSVRFDGNGYMIANTDSAGQTTTYVRDLTTSQRRLSIGPCNCAQTSNTYDASGNLIGRIDRSGHQTSWAFDPKFNRVTVYTDKLGNKTTYGYDTNGHLISRIDALGGQEIYAYDPFGEITASTDALGHSTHFEYDPLGNLTALTDSLGNRATATFDNLGRITSRVDPMGRTSTFTYDIAGAIASSVDSAGGTTSFTYDENGNNTSVKDPLGNTWTKSYDAKNRLVALTDPLGRTTRYKYDLNDQVVAVVSPENRTASVTYDSRGLVVTRSDPSGAVTTYAYDNEAHRTSITDPRGSTTTYTYDLLGNIVASRDPLGKATADTYDAQSNLIQHVDRLGRTTTFIYDALNRVSSVVLPDATMTYSYDAASRPVRIDDTESGSIQWVYDEANRLLSAIQTAGTVQYTYNAAGQRTSMTAADRLPVNYAYDSAGRVSTISQGTDVFTYTYDAASDVVSLQRPNGVTTAYSYDANRNLVELQHGTAGAIEDYHYTYTSDNFIASISSLASAPLLPSSTTVGTADPANRITASGSDTLTYDDQGQSTGKSNSQGSTQYIWDARGRLTQVILPNSQAVTYQYDPLGRRVSRSANGIASQFLYDGLEAVLDKNSDGSIVEYLNGPGIDKKLRQVSAVSGPLYFLRDHLGSTIALLGPTGSVVERIQYDPYGASTGSAFTRYLYTGREFDSATGFIFYRARYYDPKLQRFIIEDPVGPGSGTNFYEYCNGNPVQCADPKGLQAEPPEEIEPEREKENEPKPEARPNRGGQRNRPESLEELGEMLREQREKEELEREEVFRKKAEEFYKRNPEGPKEGVCYVRPEDEEFAKLEALLKKWADPFGEGARFRALGTGTDGRYRISEDMAARQFEAQTNMRLTRSKDSAYDWTTPIGGKLATVDAVGGLEAGDFKQADFENAIREHLYETQGLDFVAVSTAGLTPAQTAQVQAYINSLPPAAQARIIFLGSH